MEKRQEVACDNCCFRFLKSTYEINETLHNFCSKSCAAVLNNKLRLARGYSTKGETKEGVCVDCMQNCIVGLHAVEIRCLNCRKQLKRKTFLDNNTNHFCAYCKLAIESPTARKYCSSCIKNRMQDAGRKSAASQQRRSKNEILFAELCKAHFPQFNITNNEPFFKDNNGYYWDADVIIHDIKTAILWDGQWHRIQISKKQSLLQVQARDKIKRNIIKANGYATYVINDYGKHDEAFVRKEFAKFIDSVLHQ